MAETKTNTDALEELSKLLKKVIDIYDEDREIAKTNLDRLETNLEQITMAVPMSEEARLEKEVNTAVGLVFKAGERVDKVIQVVAKILVTQLVNINLRIELF